MLSTILSWLLATFSGPLLGQITEAYKAKIAAGTSQDTLAAGLATRELEVQQAEIQARNQLKIAQVGHWYEPEKLFAYTLWLYFTKVFVWDAALHMGITDPVSGDVATWGGLVIAFYFGTRGVTNVAQIVTGAFKR